MVCLVLIGSSSAHHTFQYTYWTHVEFIRWPLDYPIVHCILQSSQQLYTQNSDDSSDPSILGTAGSFSYQLLHFKAWPSPLIRRVKPYLSGCPMCACQFLPRLGNYLLFLEIHPTHHRMVQWSIFVLAAIWMIWISMRLVQMTILPLKHLYYS